MYIGGHLFFSLFNDTVPLISDYYIQEITDVGDSTIKFIGHAEEAINVTIDNVSVREILPDSNMTSIHDQIWSWGW